MTRRIKSSHFSDIVNINLAKKIDADGIAAARKDINDHIRQRLQNLAPPPSVKEIRQRYDGTKMSCGDPFPRQFTVGVNTGATKVGDAGRYFVVVRTSCLTPPASTADTHHSIAENPSTSRLHYLATMLYGQIPKSICGWPRGLK